MSHPDPAADPENMRSDDDLRRAQEEARAIEESIKAQAYLDFHHERGTGTWRAWPFTDQYDMTHYSDKPGPGATPAKDRSKK